MRIIFASLILTVLYTGAALAQNAYIANSGTNTVETPTGSVVVGTAPVGIAASSDGKFVYVVNSTIDGTVSVIQTSDNTVVATVDVGSPSAPTPSAGIAVTPDGKFVYVANPGLDNVSVIQTSNNTVVATVGVGNVPAGIAIPNNDHVFVANAVSGTLSIIEISSNTVVATVTKLGDTPVALAAGPSGEFIYVANNDSDNVTIVGVSGALTDPTQEWENVAVGQCPGGIATSTNSTLNLDLIYVTNSCSNTVTIINEPFFTIEATVDVEDSPAGIAATPDGNFIYVTHLNSKTTGIIEFSGDSWSEKTFFPTGDSPIAVAIAPSVGLGAPDPDPPMGDGNGSSSNSCSLAAPGAMPSFPLYLLIPAFILVSRLRRRRTS
jgi:YVTN family beta-propeller protein